MAKKIKKPKPKDKHGIGETQSRRLNTLATMSTLVGESKDQKLNTMGRAMTKDAYMARALEEKRGYYPNNAANSQLNKYEMDAIAKSFYDAYPQDENNTYSSVADASIYKPVTDSGVVQARTPNGLVDTMAHYGSVDYGRGFGEFDTKKNKYLVGGLVGGLTSGTAKLVGADEEAAAKAGAIGKTVGGAVESIYSPTGYADVAGGVGDIMGAYSDNQDVKTAGSALGQGANLASIFMAMGGYTTNDTPKYSQGGVIGQPLGITEPVDVSAEARAKTESMVNPVKGVANKIPGVSAFAAVGEGGMDMAEAIGGEKARAASQTVFDPFSGLMEGIVAKDNDKITNNLLGGIGGIRQMSMAMGGDLPSASNNQSNVTTEADTQFNGGELHTNGGLELTTKAEVEKGEFQHNFNGEKYIFSNNIKLT